jgi:hypothetical protein
VFPFINLSGKINSSLRRRGKSRASHHPDFSAGLFKKAVQKSSTLNRNGDKKV